MADDVNRRVLDRAHQTRRHLLFRLAELRVHRADHQVEGREAFLREIHAAVGKDVAFDAGKERQAAGRVPCAGGRKLRR